MTENELGPIESALARIDAAKEALSKAKEDYREALKAAFPNLPKEQKAALWLKFCHASGAARVFTYNGRAMFTEQIDPEYHGEEFSL